MNFDDSFMRKIQNIDGFAGFLDCYDAIKAEFHFVDEKKRRIEIGLQKGLPDDYTPTQMSLKHDHDFWREFYEYINDYFENGVPSYFVIADHI